MLELVHSPAESKAVKSWSDAAQGGLTVGLARSSDELRQIQQLRFNVFSHEMGARLPGSLDGLDVDRYDQFCEHLMVREEPSQRVVGTYRVLTPEKARLAGCYYSESEFDLSGVAHLRGELVEFGRSCTHENYRNGSVIMLLWSGLAEILRRGGYRYVLGCASVSLRDDGVTAAEVWRMVAPTLRDPATHLVRPLHRYPVEKLDSELPARVPPLIKGYLKLGAKVCGEPAWDPDFNTADFPMLLSVDDMDDRYRKHFGLDTIKAMVPADAARQAHKQVA